MLYYIVLSIFRTTQWLLRLQLGICLSDCYGHHTHIVEGDLNEGHINTHYDQMADSRAVLYYKHVKQVTHPNTFNSYYLDHPIEYPVTAHEPLKGLCKVKKFQKSQKNWKWVGGSRSHSDKNNWKIFQKQSFASVQFAPAWLCTWRHKANVRVLEL